MNTGRASKKLKVGVLISGRGSNLQSLIDAAADADYPAEIALVLSNKPGAAGLERAAKAGIACATIDHRGFAERADFDAAMTNALEDAGVELVCLAGFMRLVTPGFIDHWFNRLINIHPSLLPAFKGLHVHERALEAGVKLTGCTVHFVRFETDTGPIIIQAAVPVDPLDTSETLAARVLTAEHRIYPTALALIGQGRVAVEGEIVRIDGAPATGMLTNPPVRA